MDLKQINAYIRKATNIEQSLNEKVRFRGPRAKISTKTIAILEKLGYELDSSIFSQRLDILSSNLINYNWLFTKATLLS